MALSLTIKKVSIEDNGTVVVGYDFETDAGDILAGQFLAFAPDTSREQILSNLRNRLISRPVLNASLKALEGVVVTPPPPAVVVEEVSVEGI